MPSATPVPTALPTPNTGINPWWSYKEKPLAGIGRALVNVANGNLLVQAGDIDIHERGLDLAFRRTYNSQSQHDSAGTDGATPSVFGNGWTNTFDAHLAYHGSVMSVYDIDGARYDYTADGSGGWTPPPGMQGTTLIWDNCNGYQWTQKTGTIYYFWQPTFGCSLNASNAGYLGRLYEIIGRNSQNYIRFTYGWVGSNPSSAQNIATIVAAHSDGNALVMQFAQFGSYTELASIACGTNTQPVCTSQQITYSYDTNGNLLLVTRPGNATDDATRTQQIASLKEQYWYDAGTHEMQCAGGPRFVSSSWSDGSNYGFTYDANTTSGRLTWISDYGLVDFTPGDGTGAQLQPGPPMTGNTLWRQMEFTYLSAETQMTDTDGHTTRWWYDGNNRVTSTAGYTGSGTNWLVSQATWDANNNLTSTIDPRGASLPAPNPYETDYAYDTGGKNLIAVAEPAVPTSSGSLRPTVSFSYDQFNNVVASCDANFNVSHGSSWTATPAPTDSLCPGGPGAALYAYVYSSSTYPFAETNEPYGLPLSATTPSGYQTTYSYGNGAVFDNYGLPTQITGISYTQADGTTRTPTATYTYDPYGDVASVNKGNGATNLVYDALNRLATITDADSHTSYRYYNPDGTVSKTEDPYQHANGWGNTTSYDADGNSVSATAYRMTTYNSAPAPETTSYWYDGEDRLVEVQQPQDTKNDLYQKPWATRYIYDLTQNSSSGVTIGSSATYFAHGNLYKTQELLPASAPVSVASPAPLTVPNTTFQDLNGNAFDVLDRPTARYSFISQSGTSAETLIQEALTYDQSSYFTGYFAGRLTADCKSAQPQQCQWFNYDQRGATTQVHFGDTLSADRSATYDPDGHTMSITSAVFGTNYYGYNADGLKATEQEAQGGGVTSPATFTHEYYPDDAFKQLDVTSSESEPNGIDSVLLSARREGTDAND